MLGFLVQSTCLCLAVKPGSMQPCLWGERGGNEGKSLL